MKKSILSCFLLISAMVSYSQSQYEMNMETYNSYLKAEKQMQNVISEIEENYANDREFIKALHTSQKKWIEYRDAYMTMRFPNDRRYGSAHPMCINNIAKDLVQRRVIQLQSWLFLYTETDMCNGTMEPIYLSLCNSEEKTDSIIVRFDAHSPNLSTWDYYKYIHDCARAMNSFIGEKSVEEYIEMLVDLRVKHARYAKIVERPVSKQEFEMMQSFPLFNLIDKGLTPQVID
jgi:uncharacterized protein YecT (DUF1311 family)